MAFRAEVLRRAARIERRRRRARLLVVVPSLLLVASLAALVLRDTGDDRPSVTAANPAEAELTSTPIDVPGHEAIAVATRPDGSLWLLSATEDGRRHVGLVVRSGWEPVADLPASSTSSAIASDAAGRAWLTDPAGSAVHRVDDEGGIETWPTPTPPSRTGAVDLQGRFWFGEPERNVLRAQLADGTARDVVLPGGRQPDVVGPGPSGVVAYGARDAAVLGTLADGRVVEYGLVDEDARVTAVAPGPGPALWYAAAAPGGGYVGRLTPTSELTSHPVDAEAPGALTLGSDGRLWFSTAPEARVRQRTLDRGRERTLDRRLLGTSWALDTSGGMWAVDGESGRLLKIFDG